MKRRSRSIRDRVPDTFFRRVRRGRVWYVNSGGAIRSLPKSEWPIPDEMTMDLEERCPLGCAPPPGVKLADWPRAPLPSDVERHPKYPLDVITAMLIMDAADGLAADVDIKWLRDKLGVVDESF